MICPKCGKTYEGAFCPSCGEKAPDPAPEARNPADIEAETGGNMEKEYRRDDAPPAFRSSHWLRNSLIAVLILALLSAGAAVAAQQYGEAWGFRLPTAESSDLGSPYEETLPSGHYVVGIDIPAGTYTILAQSGQGRLFTAQGVVDAELIAEGGPDTVCGYEGIVLAVGDTMTITGMTVQVTGTASSSTSARSNTATETVTLAVLTGAEGTTTGGTTETSGTDGTDESGETTVPPETGETEPAGTEPTSPTAALPAPTATFIAGKDFPAGVYSVEVLRGSGQVSAGSVESGGIDSAMALEETDGAVKEFRNVNLSEGLELTVTGLDIRLVPSR